MSAANDPHAAPNAAVSVTSSAYIDAIDALDASGAYVTLLARPNPASAPTIPPITAHRLPPGFFGASLMPSF
jgi:hypothetical protein